MSEWETPSLCSLFIGSRGRFARTARFCFCLLYLVFSFENRAPIFNHLEPSPSAGVLLVCEGARRDSLNGNKPRSWFTVHCSLTLSVRFRLFDVRADNFGSILWTGRFYGPDQDEGDLGELPGTTSGQSRGDGTGVLQRLSETSH